MQPTRMSLRLFTGKIFRSGASYLKTDLRPAHLQRWQILQPLISDVAALDGQRSDGYRPRCCRLDGLGMPTRDGEVGVPRRAIVEQMS